MIGRDNLVKNALRAYSLKLLPCEALVVELEKRARGEESPSFTTTNLSAILRNRNAFKFSNAYLLPLIPDVIKVEEN